MKELARQTSPSYPGQTDYAKSNSNAIAVGTVATMQDGWGVANTGLDDHKNVFRKILFLSRI